MIEWILGGLAFGFAGSVHCIGMCGPLALSLPGTNQPQWQFLTERGLYNLGRALTYTGLGVLVGFAGHVVSLAGAQKGLSICVGVLMIAVATVPWVARQIRQIEQSPSAFLEPVTESIGSLYRTGGPSAMLVVGLLNGLLPCGFVYAALATAVTSGSIHKSALFMAAFGIGTAPAMLGVSLAGRLASTQWRTRLQRLIPLGLVLVGLLLIIRGMGLGRMFSPILG